MVTGTMGTTMNGPPKCKECGTPLSSYNKGAYCYAHTIGMVVYIYKPTSLCPEKNAPLVRHLEGYIGRDRKFHEIDFGRSETNARSSKLQSM